MQKDRGFRFLVIFAICIALTGLGVGYSVLNTSLIINTKTTVKGSSWSIKFDNVAEPVLVGSAAVESPAVVTTTSISIDVSVKKPGDSITYTFDVTNDGTLDAKLSDAPALVGLDEAAASNVTFTLTYADGSAISENDTLDAGTTRNLKLTVVFNSSVSSVSETDAELNLSATLLYIQK